MDIVGRSRSPIVIGQKFGRLTVVRFAGKNKHGAFIYECICECDTSIIVTKIGTNLISGATSSCGCLFRDKLSERNKKQTINLIGKRFGRLLVKKICSNPKDKAVWWTCECDCGNIIDIRGYCLTKHVTKSCGCLAKELKTKHGLSNSPEKRAYDNMMNRCYNDKDKSHKNHGGRGIKVCEGWQRPHGFMEFYNDMGPKPSKELSLDRIDNDLYYSCGHCNECKENKWKSNCRWATKATQSGNRRSVNKLQIDINYLKEENKLLRKELTRHKDLLASLQPLP